MFCCLFFFMIVKCFSYCYLKLQISCVKYVHTHIYIFIQAILACHSFHLNWKWIKTQLYTLVILYTEAYFWRIKVLNFPVICSFLGIYFWVKYISLNTLPYPRNHNKIQINPPIHTYSLEISVLIYETMQVLVLLTGVMTWTCGQRESTYRTSDIAGTIPSLITHFNVKIYEKGLVTEKGLYPSVVLTLLILHYSHLYKFSASSVLAHWSVLDAWCFMSY